MPEVTIGEEQFNASAVGGTRAEALDALIGQAGAYFAPLSAHCPLVIVEELPTLTSELTSLTANTSTYYQAHGRFEATPTAEESATLKECPCCLGCGQIADSEDGEPWSMWEDLPSQGKLAMAAGLVKPISCPVCNGKGRV